MTLRRTAAQLTAHLHAAFPPEEGGPATVVEHLAEREIRLRMPVGDRVLRPGGTVSGPTQFALVDSAPV
jgi:acyl-coenzyme A thioesterase PaaI-like protein